MDFLSELLKYTKDYESPTSFWKWAGITTISATIRDHCYRKQGDTLICPNIYTLLLASSAEHRKGRPVALCEKLVRKVESTKVISGRSSIQAILDELARGESNPKTGVLQKGGSALFSAPELSAGVVNDPDAIKILTDIYDFREEYTSRLRGSGTFRIKNICFTMMAASNEELLRDVYDSKALFGGLLGRTFLVKPDEFRPANSLWDVQDTSIGFNHLLKILRELANIQGEFEIEPAAREIYDNWYKPFREAYRGKSDKSGLYGRIHTSIFKLSMIFCINYSKALLITAEHMEEAIREGTSLIPNYHSFIMSQSKGTAPEAATLLIQHLYSAKDRTVSRKRFLAENYNKLDVETLDKAVQALQEGGMIEMRPIAEGVGYFMSKQCWDMLNQKEQISK